MSPSYLNRILVKLVAAGVHSYQSAVKERGDYYRLQKKRRAA
jgi:hypothetical protein